MSPSPTPHYTSYGAITPTRRPPSLRSPPQDDSDAFSETGSPLFSDSPGTLHRGLSSRQVQMIAIGGAIGTGLFLGTGRSLAQGGPASMFICYSIVAFIVYVTLLLLGEMATQYPIAGECFSLSVTMFAEEQSCIYGFCQCIQMYRVNRETSLLRVVAFGNLGADFGYMLLPLKAYNLLRILISSSTPRILQCLCYQVLFPSLRIRPLVELLVQ